MAWTVVDSCAAVRDLKSTPLSGSITRSPSEFQTLTLHAELRWLVINIVESHEALSVRSEGSCENWSELPLMTTVCLREANQKPYIGLRREQSGWSSEFQEVAPKSNTHQTVQREQSGWSRALARVAPDHWPAAHKCFRSLGSAQPAASTSNCDKDEASSAQTLASWQIL